MRNFKIKLFLVLLSLSQMSFASESENTISYESIVDQLKAGNTSYSAYGEDPFENVKIHLGVGVTNNSTKIEARNSSNQANFSGFQTSLGIDLFSSSWIAEGVIRNFSDTKNKNGTYSLQEFDLRFIYQSSMNNTWAYQFGTGLSARYLSGTEILDRELNTSEKVSYSTPSSLFHFGVRSFINPKFSIGGDLAYRASMIGDTGDKNSVDLTIRMDGHF